MLDFILIMEAVATGQTFRDVMLTPIFISDDLFEELAAPKRISENAMDWSELPIGVIYQVKAVIPIYTKHGPQTLLVLIDNDAVDTKVWAPKIVIKDLKSGMKTCYNAYIKSLGEQKIKLPNGRMRKFFDFETVYV